jgi:hypothetical protein
MENSARSPLDGTTFLDSKAVTKYHLSVFEKDNRLGGILDKLFLGGDSNFKFPKIETPSQLLG